MIRHVILWQFKEEFSESEKAEKAQEIKTRMEALQGQIQGLLEVKVIIDPLPSSNTDIYLDSTVEDEAALETYQKNPEHMDIKKNLIQPSVRTRLCMDYKE